MSVFSKAYHFYHETMGKPNQLAETSVFLLMTLGTHVETFTWPQPAGAFDMGCYTTTLESCCAKTIC